MKDVAVCPKCKAEQESSPNPYYIHVCTECGVSETNHHQTAGYDKVER